MVQWEMNCWQLTGVGNRYKLEKDYKMLKKICCEKDCKVVVGIIDIDYFKQVNDTYGHLRGDFYLKEISQIIKEETINTGGVYRYGGDEFVVLLIDVDDEEVQKIAEKIKRNIEKRRLESTDIGLLKRNYNFMEQKSPILKLEFLKNEFCCLNQNV